MILDEKEVVDFIEPAKQYVEYISKLIETYFDDLRTNKTIENTSTD